MTEQKLTELLRHAYQWGRDNGSNRSEKNFNDFLQTEAVQQALSIANVSKSFAVGKEVKIISNKHGNEFKITEKVILVNQEEDGSWEATNGKETWWIEEYEAIVC